MTRKDQRFIGIRKIHRTISNRRIEMLHRHRRTRTAAHLMSRRRKIEHANQLLVQAQHIGGRPVQPDTTPPPARKIDADTVALPLDLGGPRCHRRQVQHHGRTAQSGVFPPLKIDNRPADPARASPAARARPASDRQPGSSPSRGGRPLTEISCRSTVASGALPSVDCHSKPRELVCETVNMAPIPEQIVTELLESDGLLAHDALRTTVYCLTRCPTRAGSVERLSHRPRQSNLTPHTRPSGPRPTTESPAEVVARVEGNIEAGG